MSIRTNRIKREIMPLSAAAEWLEENPHRKAEVMTGVMISDTANAANAKKTSNLFTTGKPTTSKLARTETSDAQAKYALIVEQRNSDLKDFETRLKNKELVKKEFFGERSSQTVWKMVKELRNKGLSILVLRPSDSNSIIGWVLEDTLEGLSNG